MSRSLFSGILVSALTCAMCYGAGFSILEQSVSGLGRALAGQTASTADPSALYFNPAGAAWVERPTLVVGNHLLTGKVRFQNNGSTLTGSKSGDIIGSCFIPNLNFSYPIGDGLNLNFSASATSGTETNYNPSWMGRYYGVDTSIAVLELQPSVSYRINDELAFGIGVLAQHSEVYMKNMVDTTAFGGDSRMKLAGDGWSFGFTAGAVYRPFEGTTFGIGYRSKMDQDVSMKAKLSRVPAAMSAALGKGYFKDAADLTMNMPQNVNFGVQQVITDKLTLMADICWTDWSSMKELEVKFGRGTTPMGQKSVTQMKWHDSWRFSLGGEYYLNEKWTLRAGTCFDERTVTKHENKSPMMPDSNRYWMTLGFSYQWSPQLRFDFAWNHIIFQPSHCDLVDAKGRHLRGRFCGYTDLLSAGIKYEF